MLNGRESSQWPLPGKQPYVAANPRLRIRWRFRFILRAIAALLAFSVGAPNVLMAASDSPRQISAGSYRILGKGMFRRVIVFANGQITYDVWRATPDAAMEHLHFELSAPTKPPEESAYYRVRSGGKNCDPVGLRYYRGADGIIVSNVLLFSYNSLEQPLGWTYHPYSAADRAEDERYIAGVAKLAEEQNFYSSLDKGASAELLKFVPRCK